MEPKVTEQVSYEHTKRTLEAAYPDLPKDVLTEILALTEPAHALNARIGKKFPDLDINQITAKLTVSGVAAMEKLELDPLDALFMDEKELQRKIAEVVAPSLGITVGEFIRIGRVVEDMAKKLAPHAKQIEW